jgi:hypothetical protein
VAGDRELRGDLLAVVGAALLAASVLLAIERVNPLADARWDDNVGCSAPSIVTAHWAWSEGSPFWDPWCGFGEPLVPQLNAGVLYPPSLVLGLVAPIEDIPEGFVVFHAALAAAGAALLARRLGRSTTSATLAGVAYGLGAPFLYTARCWMCFAAGAAWTPWIVAALLVAARGSLAAVALAAVALGLQLLEGGAEAALWSFILGAVLSLLDERRAPGWLRRGVAACLLGSLIASPFLLETAALLRGSNRDVLPSNAGGQIGLPAIAGAVFPLVPAWREMPWLPPRVLHTALYQGFVPLLLAAAGLPRARARHERALLVAAALAIFLALGWHTGAAQLWDALPLLRVLHHPVGRLPVAGLAIALLAASGADAGLSRRALATTAGLLLGACGAVLAGIAFIHLDSRGMIVETGGRGALLAALTVASAAALAVAPVANRRAVALAATVALLALQLAFFWTGPAEYRPTSLGEPAAVAAWSRASLGRVAPVWNEHELLSIPLPTTCGRDTGGVLGFPSASSIATVYPAELASIWGYSNKGGIDHVTGGAHWARLLSGSVLEAAGIQLVHGGAPLREAVALSPPMHLREKARGTRSLTYENEAYVGRAYRVARAEGATLALDDFVRPDLLDVALVDSRSPLAGRTFERGRVLSFAERPGVIDVAVEPVPGPSLLVVTTSFAPGWRALADGTTAPVFAVQTHLSGVLLPAGARSVALRYRSAPLEVGFVLAALSLAACGAILVRARIRHAATKTAT